MSARYISRTRKQKTENRKQKKRKPALAAITTAVPLTKEQERKVKSWIKASLGNTIKIQTVIDPKVIAGIRVRAGDWLFDGTLKGELERAKQALIAS